MAHALGEHQVQVGQQNTARILSAITVFPLNGLDITRRLQDLEALAGDTSAGRQGRAGLGRTTVMSRLYQLVGDGKIVHDVGRGYRLPQEVPDHVTSLVYSFSAQEPLVEVWCRVPDVDDGEDDEACDQLSARFAAWCREHGQAAQVVEADRFAIAFVGYHRWTQLEVDGETWNVDFTARQYCNLQPDRPEWLKKIPCPLVWQGTRQWHPVTGEFDVLLRLDEVAEARAERFAVLDGEG